MAEWVRVNAYHMTSGIWTVCKYSIDGKARYGLYTGRTQGGTVARLIGVFDSATEAKEAANG